METRNTLQKSLILQIAQELNHPSADNIYQAISVKYPSVSRGTVYRNLTKLVALGKLQKVTLPDSADRFDKTTDKHYHLHCRICRRVDDANLPYQTNILETISDTKGYQIERHDIVLEGICPGCLEMSVNESDADRVNR